MANKGEWSTASNGERVSIRCSLFATRSSPGVIPMQKWNMIIDVAECTNCQLCTLAAMDEYVGNEFPGYAAPMPKHGHRWIDILPKERGQAPMIDLAYVPTMCNHCDDAPCIKAAKRSAR